MSDGNHQSVPDGLHRRPKGVPSSEWCWEHLRAWLASPSATTLADLAWRTGIHPESLSRFLRTGRGLGPRRLARLLRHLRPAVHKTGSPDAKHISEFSLFSP